MNRDWRVSTNQSVLRQGFQIKEAIFKWQLGLAQPPPKKKRKKCIFIASLFPDYNKILDIG